MKTIYIARHAKSSWRDIELLDVDRPLKSRGVTDAMAMAKKLKKKKINLDAVITSPAIRALHTAMIYCRELDFPLNRIEIRNRIYESDVQNILSVLIELDAAYNSVLLVGHDPSLSNFVNMLCAKTIEKLPTSSICALEVEIDSWKELVNAKATELFFYTNSK